MRTRVPDSPGQGGLRLLAILNCVSESAPKRRVVIGGGISGLAAACRLVEIAPADEVLLLESGRRLGGVLETVKRDGFLIEQSADNFITDVPWGFALCRRLGLENELLPTAATGRRALVVHRGRLVPVPDGFMLLAPSRLWPVLNSSLLSWRGKLRLAREPWIPPRKSDGAEETLAEFSTRRLGSEAYQRIVAPLVAAIYGGDPARLSVAATMPRFLEMEANYGSLWRAVRHRRAQNDDGQSGARYGLFMAPRDGMSKLIEALASRLPPNAVRLQTCVESLERGPNGWRLRIGGEEDALTADGVILATPIHATAALLQQLDPRAAELCRSVELSSSVVVSLGFDVRGTSFVAPGFGFVVPAAEGRPILAASFASAKFPGRAPEGHVLVRVFVGGPHGESLLDRPDEELVKIAAAQLAELAGLSDTPVLSLVRRWPQSMPQYYVGHRHRMARLTDLVHALGGMALAGSAYHGVGIPHCIHSGELAAERLVNSV